MSKFYQEGNFENNFRYFSHLVVLLFAAENGSDEQKWARSWYQRIISDPNRSHVVFTRVVQVLSSTDDRVVSHHWRELGKIPGFFSENERENDPVVFAKYLRDFYAVNDRVYHVVPDLVYGFNVRENSSYEVDLNTFFEPVA